jgi:phosphoribosyl-ATP pyrophosphohydrolase/phosphoribosyl-AMP cyclohydrolase
MNPEAYQKTVQDKRVTFFSRSKNRLWTKGEQSGNYLEVKSILHDCDQDALLIKATPKGPTCHTGEVSCFNSPSADGFLYRLEQVIQQRLSDGGAESYTKRLYNRGINKVAQKVGEEAVELVIEAKDNNAELFLNEAADLFYHYTLLLAAKGFSLNDVEQVLAQRSTP